MYKSTPKVDFVFLCKGRLPLPKDTLKKSSRLQRQEFSTLILLGFTFGKNDVAE